MRWFQRHRGMLLSAVVGAAVAWFLIAVTIPFVAEIRAARQPASDWLDVKSVIVEDSPVGVEPVVYVDRTVKQSVFVERLATVWKQDRNGEFFRVCSRMSALDYREGAVLPPGPLDISWWMDVPSNPPCPPLVEGTYVMSVWYTLHPPGAPEKNVRVESNVFRIYDPKEESRAPTSRILRAGLRP